MPNRACILKQQFLQSVASPWEKLLPEELVQELLAKEKITYYQSIYTPIVTLWAMISQVLDPDKSLSQAVKRMSTWLSAAGVKPPSSDTGAYSKARKRLPEKLVQQLVPIVAEALEKQVPIEQQWCGRRVRVLDGTTVLMNDTAANQAEYPQHSNQKAGCGWTIAKIVVLFSLLTGAVVSAGIASLASSEIVMSRLIYANLVPDDVILADQAYGNYVDLVLVKQQGADAVFRKNHLRKTDFRRGKKLGIGDHKVVWNKPQQCPNHMTVEEFEALPSSFIVREVCLRIKRRGFRDERIIVVTTLVDAKRYTVEKLTSLYGLRWSAAEVNLRYLKTTLKMEMLTAKTPVMVRKEIWTHLLAYTLLRTIMWQAVSSSENTVFQLSFQSTRQQFNLLLSLLATTGKRQQRQWRQLLLEQVATNLLTIRPERSEPRVLKRRPKPYPRMQEPRSVLKAKLRA
ncbi:MULTISPECIES: IS4 family transposase [unclassified Microcoleus]|uniref:IS4 family transposase n=1 Tax=unclassified Microcoleus TaxID=2642155 RepID=UPI00403F7C32